MADQFAVLEFEDVDLEVRVRVSGVSIRALGELVAAYNEAATTFMPEPFDRLIDCFAPFLDSHDAEWLREQDINLVLAIVIAWLRGVREVPLPLPRRSSGGDTSEDQTAA